MEDTIYKTRQTTLQNFDLYTDTIVMVVCFVFVTVFTKLCNSIIAINVHIKNNSPLLTIYNTYKLYGFFGGMKEIRKMNTEQWKLSRKLARIYVNDPDCIYCYVSNKYQCKFCKFWKKYHLKRKTLALKGLLKYFPKDIVRYKIWPLLTEN